MSDHTPEVEAASLVVAGRILIRIGWVATGLFAVSAGAAAARLIWWFQGPALAVALTLFALGTGAMLWGLLGALARSRRELISVAGLFLGSGSAPAPVRGHLLGATVVQLVIGVATASIRPFTTLAFGTLVPIFGLGLMCLWSAKFGKFPERPGPGATRATP